MIIIRPDIPNIHELEPDLAKSVLSGEITEDVFDWMRPDGRVLVRLHISLRVGEKVYEHDIASAIIEAYNTLRDFLEQDFSKYEKRDTPEV